MTHTPHPSSSIPSPPPKGGLRRGLPSHHTSSILPPSPPPRGGVRGGLPFLLLIISTLSLPLHGQGSERSHSLLFGFGTSNILDTYLSPYSYKGIEARIIYQTERPTRLWDSHISFHTQTDINADYVKNPAKNAKDYAVGIRFSAAWLYNFRDIHRWHFAAGLAASAYAGGIYNDRNGNNPAQGKLNLLIDLTAQSTYRFPVKGKWWKATYSLSIPFVGIAFSPMYGQSYYEIFSLKNYDHNVVFATPLNTPSMRHLLTLDIPLGKSSLRIGCAAHLMQARWNRIRYHAYSLDIMIGYTKHFIAL